MAFTKLNLKLGRGSFNSSSTITNLGQNTYKSEVDSFSVITSAGYFPDSLGQDGDIVQVGDLMQIQDSTQEERMYVLTSLSPLAMILDSGNVQEESLSFVTGAFGPYPSTLPVTLELERIGKLVICQFPEIISTATLGSSVNIVDPLPVQFRPKAASDFLYWILSVEDNGVRNAGAMVVNTGGNIVIHANVLFGNFSGAGNTGFEGTAVNWLAD